MPFVAMSPGYWVEIEYSEEDGGKKTYPVVGVNVEVDEIPSVCFVDEQGYAVPVLGLRVPYRVLPYKPEPIWAMGFKRYRQD